MKTIFFSKINVVANKLFFVLATIMLFAQKAYAQGGPPDAPGADLTVQHIICAITRLACWLTNIALLLTFGAIVLYGLQIMISKGDPAQFSSAKKNLLWAIAGTFVILGVYVIIATVANAVNVDVGTLSIPLDCSSCTY